MDYNIAIVDDSRQDAEYVAALVRKWAQASGHTAVLSLFHSAEAFLFAREDEQCTDMLLLDIEMGEMNGVELAKKIRQENTYGAT